MVAELAGITETPDSTAGRSFLEPPPEPESEFSRPESLWASDSTEAPGDGPDAPGAEDWQEPADEEGPASEEPEPFALRSLESYSQQELDQLYLNGQLDDPALVARREQLNQTEQNRNIQEQAGVERYRAREAEESRLVQQARMVRDATLATNHQRLAEGGDPELIREANQRALTDYDLQASSIHVAPFDQTIRAVLQQVGGNSSDGRQTQSTQDTTELLGELYRTAFTAGQNASTSAGMVAPAFSQVVADARKRAVDDFKAANAPPGNPDTSGTKGRAGRSLSLAQIQSMPTSEWLSQGDHETRTKMLEDAHVRAAKGGR